MARLPRFSYAGGLNDLNQHYRDLLGLNDSWTVDEVDLDLTGTQLVIHLSFAGSDLICPESGVARPRSDTAPQRTWRHLDTMRFATEIRAAMPRCRYEKCGVKTIRVSWAGKHSRFTLMFDAFAIRVLQAAANVKRAAQLLGLSWDGAHRILEAAVERGLQRRNSEPVPNVGIDDKSFGRGHNYVALLTDIDRSRLLEVVPDRTAAACHSLWRSLTSEEIESLRSVAMDMWHAFMSSAAKTVPGRRSSTTSSMSHGTSARRSIRCVARSIEHSARMATAR